ncbi:MAG: glycosyltransferase [Chloroflexi bacterium]|nr:glycosyltransferase [Chloroflexota bacterium]
MSLSCDIVFFLHGEWEDHTRDRLVLALGRCIGREGTGKVLAVEIPVCLVTSPWVRRERFMRWLRGERHPRQVASNVFLYRPWLPLTPVLAPAVLGASGANRLTLRAQLGRVLGRLGFTSPRSMVWVTDPYHRDFMGLVSSSFHVFNVVDDYRGFPVNRASAWRRSRIVGDEEAILRKVDVVFATAHSLAERAKALNPRTFYVPNGVDYDLFSKAAEPEVARGSPLAALPKPVFGFIGKVNEKIDYGVLNALAEAYPQGSVVLVGARDAPPGALERDPAYSTFVSMPNVRLWGEVPYEELYRLLAGFGVCLIPYVQTELTASVNPRKLHEYLASGKPVVATAIPEMARRPEAAFLATDPAEFVRRAGEALATAGREDLRHARMALAEAASWDRRAGEMLSVSFDLWERREARPAVGVGRG